MKFTINKNTNLEELASKMSESITLSMFKAVNDIFEHNKGSKSIDIDVDVHIDIKYKTKSNK